MINIVFCTLASFNLVKAQNVDQKVMAEIENVKGEFSRDQIKQGKVLYELQRANRRIKNLVEESSKLEQDRMVIEAASNDLQKKITTLNEKSNKQKTLLANRLAAIYKFSGQGLARMIFSSQSASDLERNLKILGLISSRDFLLIKDWTANKQELISKQKKLEARLEKIKTLTSKIQSREQKLEQANKYRMKILSAIRNSAKFKKSKLAAIKEKYQNDAGILDLLFKPTLFEYKGTLEWPVSGKISKKFGFVEDLEYGVGFRNPGVFIETTQAHQVRAVFDGSVAFEGELEGFGKTVILDHGDHFFSVYAHLSAVKTKFNETVKAGEVIARAGKDPLEQKQGIHFELRHFAEPYDPTKWMKGINL